MTDPELTRVNLTPDSIFLITMMTLYYKGMNDWDLRYELRAILNKLETDDRMQPMSWAIASKLIERRDKIIEEMKRRGISYQK